MTITIKVLCSCLGESLLILASGLELLSPLRFTDAVSISTNYSQLSECSHSLDMPHELDSAFGGHLRLTTTTGDNVAIPVVCAGDRGDGPELKCYRLGHEEPVGTLLTERSGAASVVINNGQTLWVTGGSDRLIQQLTSTELLTVANDSTTDNFLLISTEGKPLPGPVHHHCLQMLDSDTAVLFGGSRNPDTLDETWSLEDHHGGEWQQRAPLPVPKSMLMCGVIKDASGQKIIVAAGGLIDDFDNFWDPTKTTKTTEFLLGLDQTWEAGPDLPTELAIAQSSTTEDQTMMLVAGGVLSSMTYEESLSVYSLKCVNMNCEWTTFDLELTQTRLWFVSMIIPPYSLIED